MLLFVWSFETDIDEKKQKIEEFGEEKVPKVDRRNSDEYLRTLQLNPFADADETLFLDEVRYINQLVAHHNPYVVF